MQLHWLHFKSKLCCLFSGSLRCTVTQITGYQGFLISNSDLAGPDFLSAAKFSDMGLESQEHDCGLTLVRLHVCVCANPCPRAEAWSVCQSIWWVADIRDGVRTDKYISISVLADSLLCTACSGRVQDNRLCPGKAALIQEQLEYLASGLISTYSNLARELK